MTGNNQGETGNIQEQSGNLPALKSEKDALILKLKLEGKSYAEISAATSVPIKTLQNCLSKGGRLENAYRELLRRSQEQGKETADIVFEVAKQEARAAIERMIELSKTAGNEAALFKANEYLLALAGIAQDSSLDAMLRKLSYEEGKEKVDKVFVAIYGKPCSSGDTSSFQASSEDIARLEEIAKMMAKLHEQLMAQDDPNQLARINKLR